jgi:hypothetical protein
MSIHIASPDRAGIVTDEEQVPGNLTEIKVSDREKSALPCGVEIRGHIGADAALAGQRRLQSTGEVYGVA